MWKIPIGFGNCSASYLYIAGASIFGLIQDYLLSLSDIKKKYEYNIFGIKTVLKSHKLIRVLYGYISFIIFGIIFYYISEKSKDNKKTANKKSPLQQTFIVRSIELTTKVKIEIIIICGLYTLIKVLRKIVNFYKIGDLDFWIFNIVFISLFMYYYFRIHIYKHHKYSLLFIFFTNLCLLFIAAAIKKNDNNPKEKTIFQRHGWKCLFIIIMYIIFSMVSSFSKVASKKLMDINYLSPYKMIFYIGVFGVFFTLISLIFTGNISCGSISQYCKLVKYDEKHNTTYTYLDSISFYFSDMKDIYDNKQYKDFYIEIFIVIPLYLIANFCEFLFEILLILYLNTNYILISDCIYYGTSKLIEFIFNKNYGPKKFWVEFIAELLTLLGYTIYLEIIELKFCELDKDIKKNITERSVRESVIKDMDFDINQANEYDKDDKDSDDEDSYDERKNSIEMGMVTPS
jgi:hypothetical protein